MQDRKVTKASILSEIASIYDPIGWITPVTMKAKLVMKKLWESKLNWNEELPDNERNEWIEFRKTFTKLNTIKIDRNAYIANPITFNYYGFCDASIVGYGANAYIRSTDSFGNSKTTLICAKSRVAPVKQKSLARLELCGAVLLSKLTQRLLETITVPISRVNLNTDSTITLCWIKMIPAKLSTFVGNRVAVIQETTENFNWSHVRSNENPADIISRGIMPDQLTNSDLWWNGPSYFNQPESEWSEPIMKIDNEDPEITNELRKTFTLIKVSSLIEFIETRFSRLNILIRSFAIILRFIASARKHVRKFLGPVTLDEIEASETAIIKLIQQTFFTKEYKALQAIKSSGKGNMPAHSPIKSLNPFLDDQNVIRVGGRLKNAHNLSYNQRHQIILPKCHFTTMIIRHIHSENYHASHTALLSFVRQKYWPLQAKSIVRNIIYHCLPCYRAKPKLTEQLMGDLPSFRINQNSAFYISTVDYAGPISNKTSLTRNSATTKAYISLFKCATTKAVHLEIVTSLTTKAFLDAFDRFSSRRGLPYAMNSDNATTFEGADNELKRRFHELEPSIKKMCTDLSIHWYFISLRSPHMGGFWEIGIKAVKYHLKRVTNGRTFTYEQLYTICCKIEAIINSVPITPMSDDPNDLQVLTPGHFLIGRPLNSKPERNLININENRLDMFERTQQIQQEFWNQWSNDYLHQLQSRPKGFRTITEIKLGSMVLINESNLPSMKWLFGRIIELFPGTDGVVRNVKVKTPYGELIRNVKYLSLLPLESEAIKARECVRDEINE